MQVKYAIRGTKNPGGSQWYYPATKRRIFSQAVLILRETGHVYVRVSYGPGLFNHATLDTITAVKTFVAECTEPELLRYMSD